MVLPARGTFTPFDAHDCRLSVLNTSWVCSSPSRCSALRPSWYRSIPAFEAANMSHVFGTVGSFSAHMDDTEAFHERRDVTPVPVSSGLTRSFFFIPYRYHNFRQKSTVQAMRPLPFNKRRSFLWFDKCCDTGRQKCRETGNIVQTRCRG